MFHGSDKELKDGDTKSQAASSVSASTFKSKFLNESMMSGQKRGAFKKDKVPKTLRTKVIYYDDILQGKEAIDDKKKESSFTESDKTKATNLRDKLLENPDIDWDNDDEQVDFENCIQKASIIMPKLYLWNENAFKAFEICFTVDLNAQINNVQSKLGADVKGQQSLLDSIYVSRDLTRLARYKQIRNMDFLQQEVRNVVEHD